MVLAPSLASKTGNGSGSVRCPGVSAAARFSEQASGDDGGGWLSFKNDEDEASDLSDGDVDPAV